MTSTISIQVKALTLLFVFTLNTVVGFACSMGVNMGFNKSHHQESSAKIPVHNLEDGIKHNHATTATDHHDENEAAGHHRHDSEKASNKDNCCNHKVLEFAQLDKVISPSLDFGINPLFFTTFVSSFCHIDLLATFPVAINAKYFVRSYHPPIPDIRIAIQSFQV